MRALSRALHLGVGSRRVAVKFYTESNQSYFEGTGVGEKLGARATEGRQVIAAD